MKDKIIVFEADIKKELEEIEKLFQEFEKEVIPLLEKDNIKNFDKLAIGGYLHNFYNGIENIFKLIAKFFENNISGAMYHAELLKRMTLEIDGIRPKVIDDELFKLLNDLKGFRHVFRHSYVFEIDWEKEKITAKRVPLIFEKLKSQVKNFLYKLKNLVNKNRGSK